MDYQSDIKPSNNNDMEIEDCKEPSFSEIISPEKTPSKCHNMWKSVLNSILNNCESKDSTIKEVIDLLLSKKNIPQSESEFLTFVNNFKIIQNNPDYANIIWELVSSHCEFKKYKSTNDSPKRTDTPKFLEFEIINHHLAPEDLELMHELQNKRKSISISSHLENKWLDESRVKLSNFQTDDEDLKSIISHLTKKTFFPQSEIKFINFIKKLPKGDNYVQVLCDIIQDFKHPNLSSYNVWTEIVVNFLKKYETEDENLNAGIKDIVRRISIPSIESKFMNFAMGSPILKRYPENAKIIWDLITPLLPKLSDSDKLNIDEQIDTESPNSKKHRNKRSISKIDLTPKRIKLDQTTHESKVHKKSTVENSTITVENVDDLDYQVVDSAVINQAEEEIKKTKSKKNRVSKVIEVKADGICPASIEDPVQDQPHGKRMRKSCKKEGTELII